MTMSKKIKARFLGLVLFVLLTGLVGCEIPGGKSHATAYPEITLPQTRATYADEAGSNHTSAVTIAPSQTDLEGSVTSSVSKWSNPNVRVVKVEVTKVSDGDTIRATVDGKNQRVRLIGINSPEIAHPEDGIAEQFYGEEAFAYTKEILEGRTVYLSFDEESHDQYDRILAYLWLEDPHGFEEDFEYAKQYQFNCLLLEQGYAKFVRIPPNLTFAKLHQALAREAEEQRIGMWAKP